MIMNTEELKIIVELITGMSGDAKFAFVAYLICAKIVPIVLGWTGGLILACMGVKLLNKLILCIPDTKCLILAMNCLGMDTDWVTDKKRAVFLKKIGTLTGKDTVS